MNQTKRKNLISDLVHDLSDLFHVLPPQVKVFVFNIKEKKKKVYIYRVLKKPRLIGLTCELGKSSYERDTSFK